MEVFHIINAFEFPLVALKSFLKCFDQPITRDKELKLRVTNKKLHVENRETK